MVLEDLALELDQRLDALLVRELESLEDLGLRHLDGAPLHHDDGVLRARDDDVDVGVLELLEGGVQHPGALDPSDPHGRDRRVERDLAHVQRERRAE